MLAAATASAVDLSCLVSRVAERRRRDHLCRPSLPPPPPLSGQAAESPASASGQGRQAWPVQNARGARARPRSSVPPAAAGGARALRASPASPALVCAGANARLASMHAAAPDRAPSPSLAHLPVCGAGNFLPFYGLCCHVAGGSHVRLAENRLRLCVCARLCPDAGLLLSSRAKPPAGKPCALELCSAAGNLQIQSHGTDTALELVEGGG